MCVCVCVCGCVCVLFLLCLLLILSRPGQFTFRFSIRKQNKRVYIQFFLPYLGRAPQMQQRKNSVRFYNIKYHSRNLGCPYLLHVHLYLKMIQFIENIFIFLCRTTKNETQTVVCITCSQNLPRQQSYQCSGNKHYMSIATGDGFQC